MSSQPENPITLDSMDEGIYLVKMYSEIADSCFTPVYFDGENMYSFGAPQPVLEDEVVAIISKLDMEKVNIYRSQLQPSDGLSMETHLNHIENGLELLIIDGVDGIDDEALVQAKWDIIFEMRKSKDAGLEPKDVLPNLPPFISESFVADFYKLVDKSLSVSTVKTPTP